MQASVDTTRTGGMQLLFLAVPATEWRAATTKISCCCDGPGGSSGGGAEPQEPNQP